MTELPEEEHDSLAEIDSDHQWDEAFAKSGAILSRLAEEALAEHRAGLTQILDPELLPFS
jgi:hypothetical protein